MQNHSSSRNWDVLAWAALAFAVVATSTAEYDLARACEYNTYLAACVPGALDVYVIRAYRIRRDVVPAVLAMILVNAASHLVTARLVPVSVYLVVGVSAIAPLVVWRVHHVSRQPVEATSEAEYKKPVPEVQAVSVPVPALAVPAQTALALVPPQPSVPAVPVAVPAASTPAPRVHAPVSTPTSTDDDELIARAKAEYTDVPSVREIKARYNIGQVRAGRIRAALAS
jgi:hypothetical protein